ATSDIFFDALVLPISTDIEEDRRNALETIEGIKRIKAELPDCYTILGVSNISFGLNPASRVVLNSVFLHDAVEAGLDAAIVNASKIEPLNRIGEQELKVARDLIYDRREFDGEVCTYDPLTKFTTLFENVKAKSAKKASKGETVEERLKNHIIDGEKIGLEDELKTALESYAALDIINNILLEGMKVVGDLFGSGQMQLPFVLQSAEAMKAAVRFLEPFMEKKGGATAKGTMVYARDAFAGLHTMDKLMSGDVAQTLVCEDGDHRLKSAPPDDADDLVGEEAKLGIRKSAKPRGVIKIAGDTTHTNRSDVGTSVVIPQPPFLGSRVAHDIPLQDVFAYVNETALCKGQWQFKQGRKPNEEYQAFVAEHVRPVFEELKQRSEREGLLIPRAVYGYFHCQSSGNDLIIYDQTNKGELVRFTFPPQPAGKRLCLADYFASVTSGHRDVVAFHLVMMRRR